MRPMRTVLMFLAAAVLSGCVSSRTGAPTAGTAPPPVPPPPSDASYATVRVFFATDRNLTSSADPKEMFGTERSALRYGTSEVSIPRNHRMGELEAPSILRLEFREDPAKHVVLQKTSVTSEDAFYADLAARVRRSETANAFVFVHGYNVTFEDAARRTAQITYDLGFDGAPTLLQLALARLGARLHHRRAEHRVGAVQPPALPRGLLHSIRGPERLPDRAQHRQQGAHACRRFAAQGQT
jgi:hypothetical protein